MELIAEAEELMKRAKYPHERNGWAVKCLSRAKEWLGNAGDYRRAAEIAVWFAEDGGMFSSRYFAEAADLYERAEDYESAIRYYRKAGFSYALAIVRCYKQMGDMDNTRKTLEDEISRLEAYIEEYEDDEDSWDAVREAEDAIEDCRQMLSGGE